MSRQNAWMHSLGTWNPSHNEVAADIPIKLDGWPLAIPELPEVRRNSGWLPEHCHICKGPKEHYGTCSKCLGKLAKLAGNGEPLFYKGKANIQ